MDKGMNIRSATAHDAAPIAAILRELGWFAHINEESPTDTEARIVRNLRLCEADQSHMVLVAENAEGAVVGYISVHWLPYLMLTGPEGYVSELFILERERGKGIGTGLLEAVRRHAEERGCARLQLVTGNDYGRRFYRKLAWKERTEASNFVLPLS